MTEKEIAAADKIETKAIFAASLGPRRNEWQPIETAPMPVDFGCGPPVLVHLDSDDDERRVTVARYWGCWSTIEDGLDIDPTHWMPLPAPPTG